ISGPGNTLTVEGPGEVEVKYNTHSFVIRSNLIVNGGTVTIDGDSIDDGTLRNHCAVSGNVTVNDGSVTILGRRCTSVGYGGNGIKGNLIVNGGNITCKGGTAYDSQYLNDCGAGVTGTVTVNGGEAIIYGVASDVHFGNGIEGDVTLNGGKLKVIMESASNNGGTGTAFGGSVTVANGYNYMINDAGEYTDTFNDTAKASAVGNWISPRIRVTIPTANTNLVYNKNAQIGVAEGTDYTLSGTTSATNAGNYVATATLSNGYAWSDGTTIAKNIPWSIAPKEVGLTWGNTDFTYTGSVQTPTVTATGLVGNDTCSVTVSGGQSNPGTYTATATGLSNNNYTLPANKTTSFTIGPDPNNNNNNQNQNNNQNNNPDPNQNNNQDQNNDPNQNNNQNQDQNEDRKDPEQVNAFVERMYTKALKRASEEGGKNDWANQLLTGKSDGATLAKGFICSDEFVNKDMSNEEFLDTLYETFFDRAADEGGKATWLAKLNEGSSRTSVLAGFVNSAEFGNLCENFGIARGTMEEDGSSIYNEGVYNFVKRNYTKTLGRKGEIAGIEDWCHRINKGELTMKNVAVEFLHSKEFLNKNTTNEEYVTILYHTFMDREPDAAGLSDWVGQLDRGEKTRDEIVSGFANSVEFANIMAQYQ
ncbi:MAG: DUF4214 domain-containing protein, partial [Lachnospiraceae bacterium]|nr:DUF4214 domain-containing protein [Lachnospiraceae bacterium]